MIPDVTKLQFSSGSDTYKNATIYSGSVTFPTSLGAGAVSTPTATITLDRPPEGGKFFAYFREFTDQAYGGLGAQWYAAAAGGYWNIGIDVTTASTNDINGGMGIEINGNILTVRGYVFNPYSSAISMASLTVPFVFVDYTTAR